MRNSVKQKLSVVLAICLLAGVGSYLLVRSEANPYTEGTPYVACPPGFSISPFKPSTETTYHLLLPCNGQNLPANGTSYGINWQVRLNPAFIPPNGVQITGETGSFSISNANSSYAIEAIVEVPTGCASIQGDIGSTSITDGYGNYPAIDYSEANTLSLGPGCDGPDPGNGGSGGNGTGGTGTGSGGSGVGTGGTGTGSGTGGTGQGTGGGSSGGSSTAKKQSNQSNPLPSSSSQGDGQQFEVEPSPFIDGKEYKPGSDADTLGSSVSRTGKKLVKHWYFVIGAIAIGGASGFGYWWWRQHHKG